MIKVKRNDSNRIQIADMSVARAKAASAAGAQVETAEQSGRIADRWVAAHRSDIRRRRITMILGVLVALLTTVNLIVPAITLTKDARVLTCTDAEHEHTDACYQSVNVEAEDPSASIEGSASEPADADAARADEPELNADTDTDFATEFALDAEAAAPEEAMLALEAGSNDVVITASLAGTDMETLGYNLYAYLIADNDGKARGAKLDFANGTAAAVISDVPSNTYKVYLVYARDNRTLQTDWNTNNVLDSNTNNWVDADGGYLFGYTTVFSNGNTVTDDNRNINIVLQLPEAQSNISVSTIMDRAINYGITAENVNLPNNCYTNYAAKELNIQNQNSQTRYNHRSDGIDVVPNIAASVNNNGQPLTTEASQPANYYVVDADKGKVNSTNKEETIVRNRNEIEDRVEIMINNTLKQAEQLATKSVMKLPAGISMDVSAYPDNATIILDATAISGERNGYTITKRPGQTIVFNINGQNAAPPENIKVKLVDRTGQQVDVDGNPSSKVYVAGDEMNNAAAKEGNVWNKLIWNFPEVTGTVQANNQIGGIFLVPHGSFKANNKGGGWIVARHSVTVTNEWYGFPGDDEPFKQMIIRKSFAGIEEDDIDQSYAVRLWTHTNESTSGTTQDKLISTLVLKENGDTSLVSDPTGANDQTGYLNKGIDEYGNVFYEWKTPSISVGNEHKLTEINSTSLSGETVKLVEFTAPFSEWNDATQNYEWISRETEYGSESDFAGIFNVSKHDDWRQYAYIVNNYDTNIEPREVQVRANKVLTGGTLAAGQFKFRLIDSDGNIVSEAFNDASGSITFPTMTFDEDGTYEYRMIEVADTAQTDIVYDTAEYIVHITAEGGIAGKVTYTNGSSGKTESLPKFVNRKLDADTDRLTARKVFIDGTTGQAIELEGGEFTFKASGEAQDGEAVEYTGVNDADGMVTFYDSENEIVDIEDLETPTTFSISEVEGSYNGELGRDQEIAYDENSYQATANVTSETVTVAPWTAAQVSADSTNLTLTFTPKDATGSTYYLKPGYDPVYSEIGSDGTVTFTVPILKNYTGNSNTLQTLTYEYGKGNNYYYGRSKVGSITIRAKGGSWGDSNNPVVINSVAVDGSALTSRNESVRTAWLEYADGSYPVFVNTIVEKDSTTKFEFTKVWVSNTDYSDVREWKDGQEITVRLAGTFIANDGSRIGTSEYEYVITRSADEEDGNGFTFTSRTSHSDGSADRSTSSSSEGNTAPTISLGGSDNDHYSFVITGLPDVDTVDGKVGRWSYRLTEDQVDGYGVGYGSWDAEEGTAAIDESIGQSGIETGGYLINAESAYEMPSAGGPGTRAFTLIGTLLIIASAGTLICKRKMQ